MDWLCCFVLLLTLRSTTQNEQPIVNTEVGSVRGHYKHSYDNRIFASFEGIPYAKPPVGDLRFAEPQSAEPWAGIFDATIIHECAQHVKPDVADENEDCLYLNVYVPRKEPVAGENLDVIVHIHGGAFMLGGPAMSGPEYLIDEDVIYVNLNYRLGLFGFLSTGDDIVSGNNGLKDQVLALKWIKSNIKYFGGNPDSITIVGVSAGGASVHLHYFSNLSKGLFHKGISHSGTALAPWVIHANPLENTLKIAETVGCIETSTKDLVECLKTKSAKALSEATFSTYKYLIFPIAPFAPVIEKYSQTAFLTDHPYKLLQKEEVTDLPWINTIASDEGLILLFSGQSLEKFVDDFDKESPYILDYFQNVADTDIPDIRKKINKYYFKDVLSEEGLLKAVGDRLFKVSAQKSAHMQAKVTKSPVYFYVYAYQSDLQFPGLYDPRYKRANHASDGLLIYDVPMIPKNNGKLSENDEGMKNRLVKAVTTFAKYGIPTINGVNWEPVTDKEDWSYLQIQDKDNVAIQYNEDNHLLEFWDSLACDYWNKKLKIKDEF